MPAFAVWILKAVVHRRMAERAQQDEAFVIELKSVASHYLAF